MANDYYGMHDDDGFDVWGNEIKNDGDDGSDIAKRVARYRIAEYAPATARGTGSRGPMARCARCRKTIRKAEVRERYVFQYGFLEKRKFHEPCMTRTQTFPVTDDLVTIAAFLLREDARQDGVRRDRSRHVVSRVDLVREQEKSSSRLAEVNDLKKTVCRLTLENGTHPSVSCRAMRCPVPQGCGHEFDVSDDHEFAYHTVPTDRGCQHEEGRPACYTCHKMFCFG
jgi:hypothetical protein